MLLLVASVSTITAVRFDRVHRRGPGPRRAPGTGDQGDDLVPADIEPVADAAVFLRAGRVLLAGDADDLRAEHGMSLDGLFRSAYQIPVRS